MSLAPIPRTTAPISAKRGYAFTLTEDNGTLWLTNADYNAKILYNLDEGNATVVLADGRPTSVIINEKQQPSYERDETGFGNTAKYGYVVFDRSQYNKKMGTDRR